MKGARITAFAVLLTGAVTVAVSSLVAQEAPGEQAGDRVVRPPVVMLDGRGAQIGVTVEETREGVRIGGVDAESPAARGGVQTGDVIVDVDGERVRSARQFSRLIQETADGHSVTLGVLRDGTRQSLTVTPESRPAFRFDADRLGRDIARNLEPHFRELEPRLRELEPRLRELEPRLREFRFDPPFDVDMLPHGTSPRRRLGVELSPLTPQLADYFGASGGGVLVAGVTKDSPAEKAGLKAGDVITSIDGDRVRRTDDIADELQGKEGQVTLGILRDKRETSVKATLDTPAAARPFVRRPV